MPTFPGSGPALAQRSDTTVIQAGPPLHRGIGTLVEELTLGNGSDAAEYQFSIAFVHAARDGGVYVVDLVDPSEVGDFRSSVRKYDRTGRFVRSFGRNGQGPGEYVLGVGGLAELPDGRVLITDAHGILVYSPTGEPLGRWPARGRSGNYGSQILVDPAGFVYTYGTRPPEYGGRPSMDAARTTDSFLYRFRFDGSLVDTVVPPQAAFPQSQRAGRAIVNLLPRYFSVWSPLGYFVTSLSTTYALDLRKAPQRSAADQPGGWQPTDDVISIRRSVVPVPVQPREREDWRQSVIMYNRSGAGAESNWQWSGPDIPGVKPHIRSVAVAADGRIWIRVSQPAQIDPSVVIPTSPAPRGQQPRVDAYFRWVEPVVFDVLEPSGQYVGRVRLPDGPAKVYSGRIAIAGDVIWTVEMDGDDVPVIKRYRVRWGG